MRPSIYEKDFYAWTKEQAGLLRAGNLSGLDVDNLLEEIESMGVSEKRELRRRLARLLQHLLKWKYQPERRSTSWKSTIREQRDEIAALFDDSPSLRPLADAVFLKAYDQGRQWAIDETGIQGFLEVSPFTLEQVLDPGFLPE